MIFFCQMLHHVLIYQTCPPRPFPRVSDVFRSTSSFISCSYLLETFFAHLHCELHLKKAVSRWPTGNRGCLLTSAPNEEENSKIKEECFAYLFAFYEDANTYTSKFERKLKKCVHHWIQNGHLVVVPTAGLWFRFELDGIWMCYHLYQFPGEQ